MLSWGKKVILATVVLFVAMNLFQHVLKCSQRNFHNMCHDFVNGEGTGGICEVICDPKRFQIEKCSTSREEKQVFSALLEGDPVILKYSKSWSNEMKKWKSRIPVNQNVRQENKGKKELSDMVAGELKNVLLSRFGNHTNFDHLFGTFFAFGDLDRDGFLDFTEGATLLSHLENNEFMMLVLLQGGQHTLRFHGFCGGFYLVEKVPESTQNVYGFMDPLSESFNEYLFPLFLEPIENELKQFVEPVSSYFTTLKLYHHLRMWVYQSFYESRTPKWKERFNFIYGLLDILHYFQDNPFGPVHYCDLHTANIGVTANRTYKIIDYDILLPQNYMAKLLSELPCENHKDCTVGDFADCRGFCDKTSGFCEETVLPQDLWYFCHTLIATSLSESPPGFLGYRPLEEEMKKRGKLVKDALKFCYDLPLTMDKTEILRNILAVKEKFKQIEKLNE